MRYLTSREKHKEMEKLEKLYKVSTPDTNDGLDIELVLHLRKLNKIRGIMTQQSCSGHKTGKISHKLGQLWIRPTKRISKLFSKKAFELARSPLIEKVTILYQYYKYRGGRTTKIRIDKEEEIIDITFQGKSYGTLDKAMKYIIAFFESLSREVLGTVELRRSRVVSIQERGGEESGKNRETGY